VLNVDRSGDGGRGEWELCTGVMEFGDGEGEGDGRGLEGKLNRVQLWIEDTRDGGAVPWLGEGRPESFGGRWLRGRGEGAVTEEVVQEMITKSREVEERVKVLEGKCHCGDVRVELLSVEEEMRGRDTSAELCCCHSCRRVSGFEINAWVHWPKEKVRMASDESYAEGMKDMGHYLSSKDTHRYFCKRCGAMVFYDRPDLHRLDIGLGLFDAPEGSRAENWFVWDPDKEGVSFIEDAVDGDFAGRLAKGVGASLWKSVDEQAI
jgi:hypothetical protein